MTRYRRVPPPTEEERWLDAIRPRKDRSKGRRYNWRRILRLATSEPGVWKLFDRHGRDYVISVVNQRRLVLFDREFPEWEFRAKITEGHAASRGNRRVGKLWIMATERTPADE